MCVCLSSYAPAMNGLVPYDGRTVCAHYIHRDAFTRVYSQRMYHDNSFLFVVTDTSCMHLYVLFVYDAHVFVWSDDCGHVDITTAV